MVVKAFPVWPAGMAVAFAHLPKVVSHQKTELI
jgi:hypothetical protein